MPRAFVSRLNLIQKRCFVVAGFLRSVAAGCYVNIRPEAFLVFWAIAFLHWSFSFLSPEANNTCDGNIYTHNAAGLPDSDTTHNVGYPTQWP